ncbi:craniofacial development protein 2-like protein [Plakobranchus ocellatus]|uniref:Craniofacial development protein 2-like protein n=1 Tax=Plakobranchus ocellatus TaxID=259542 RepID=A0AAV4CDP3_9GAST|nr:craniofacial development protein 2-like protein [Plakobranchus ocellatus]
MEEKKEEEEEDKEAGEEKKKLRKRNAIHTVQSDIAVAANNGNGTSFQMKRRVFGHVTLVVSFVYALCYAPFVNMSWCLYGDIETHSEKAFNEDVEIEKFYEEIEKAKGYLKSQGIILVMRDFNAKVGDKRVGDVVEPSGIGNVNERGSRLTEWCQVNDFTISNTWYQNHPRRQWTWKSPGDRSRNKIDYILIQKRFRNAIKTSKSLPGAACDSDHIPVRLVIDTVNNLNHQNNQVHSVSMSLLFLSPFLNPIVYGIFNKHFRQTLLDLLRTVCIKRSRRLQVNNRVDHRPSRNRYSHTAGIDIHVVMGSTSQSYRQGCSSTAGGMNTITTGSSKY